MASEKGGRKYGIGVVMRAVRQGADEIGLALKAFPDSIQVHEPGTILSPTQGEIGEANSCGRSLADRVRDGLARATERQQPERGMDRG